MKIIRRTILCAAALLLTVPMLHAQNYSNYRDFSLGASLTTVLKQTDQKLADVTLTHGGPVLFQEVTWWPPNAPGPTYRSDSVEQILFSFYNGALYKMSVKYDRVATEGLTEGDMVKSISEKYGRSTTPAPAIEPASIDNYDAKGALVATWEDAQDSINLVHSAYSESFGLVLYSKRANAEAEFAMAETLRLEKLDGPKREAERQKKQTDDIEAARLKNQQNFRP